MEEIDDKPCVDDLLEAMNSLNRDREKCRYCGYSEEQIIAMEGTFHETGEVKSEFIKNLIESAKAEERKRCLEACKSTIKFENMRDWDIDSYEAGHADAVISAIQAISAINNQKNQ